MRKHIVQTVLALALFSVAALPAVATDYKVDGVHSSLSFKAQHAGISWVHGRFNDVSGTFTIDKDDPSKSSFELSVKAESVDTNNKGRDGHLRGPDFFNVKQFPTLTFKSTSVKAVDSGYEVTGDLTMHGETKPISFTLKGGKEVQFPPGTSRTGFATDLSLKRSDFGMNKMIPMIGDEVLISVGLEGTQK
jgi:polyisoprenoid-binding protein YceI